MFIKFLNYNFLTVTLIFILYTYIKHAICHSSTGHTAANNFSSKIQVKNGKYGGIGGTRVANGRVLLSTGKNALQENGFEDESDEIDSEEAINDDTEKTLDDIDADDSPDELTLESKEGDFVKQKHDKISEELKDLNPELVLIMQDIINLSISLRDITHKIQKL